MVSIVARGCWAFVGVLSGVQILGSLWYSCSHLETHWAGDTHVESKQAPPLVSLSSLYL